MATRLTEEPPLEEHSTGASVGHARGGGVVSATVTRVWVVAGRRSSLSVTRKLTPLVPSGRIADRRSPAPRSSRFGAPKSLKHSSWADPEADSTLTQARP